MTCRVLPCRAVTCRDMPRHVACGMWLNGRGAMPAPPQTPLSPALTPRASANPRRARTRRDHWVPQAQPDRAADWRRDPFRFCPCAAPSLPPLLTQVQQHDLPNVPEHRFSREGRRGREAGRGRREGAWLGRREEREEVVGIQRSLLLVHRCLLRCQMTLRQGSPWVGCAMEARMQ
jgi:hypothetical protein